jgi:hypothetical protein
MERPTRKPPKSGLLTLIQFIKRSSIKPVRTLVSIARLLNCFKSQTTSSTSKPPKTFTCFPDLPAEIQLKIWLSALPGPRIICFKARLLSGTAHVSTPEQSTLNTLYFTCKESYNTVKKHYKCHSQLGFPIWFDNDIDTVQFQSLFTNWDNLSLCRGPYLPLEGIFSTVKHLTLGFSPAEASLENDAYRSDLSTAMIRCIIRCPNLETIKYFTPPTFNLDEEATKKLLLKIIDDLTARLNIGVCFLNAMRFLNNPDVKLIRHLTTSSEGIQSVRDGSI